MRRHLLCAAIAALALPLLAETVAAAAPSTPRQEPAVSELPSQPQTDDAGSLLLLDAPLPASQAYEVLELSTPQRPIEIVFGSGEWVGGISVTGDSEISRYLLDDFIRNSPAATEARPVVGFSATPTTLSDSLRSYQGEVVESNQVHNLPDTSLSPTPQRSPQGEYTCDPRPDGICTASVNPGAQPATPPTGDHHQARLQGILERTTTRFTGADGSTYPGTLFYRKTDPSNVRIIPAYAYEHDYKIANNGYVQETSNYSWWTNVPGAYRDSRASDDDADLDFTIGSAYPWLFDPSVMYDITIQVPAGGGSISSQARLTSSVMNNDGCSFAVDPTTLIPADGQVGDMTPWCFGLTGSLTNLSLISIQPFTIKYDGSCRRWTLGNGYVNCQLFDF